MAAVAAQQPRALAGSPARLAAPPLRPGHVDRPELLARLDAALTHPLTVVRAPTGYGKTMLLARWVQSAPVRCAWVTLSADERTPSRLWPLVAGALAASVDDVGVSLRLDRVAETRSSAAQLRGLVEALTGLEDDVVLVVDDVQAAGAAVERALARLLERLPASVHLVLATRRLPDLDVAVRRARGELVELGDDDLRFDVAEAEAVVDLELSGREAGALVDRLEGWPAGIHLAGLAARRSERQLDTLRAFSGASRLVVDYLRQELLGAQPDDVHRQFLLRTSVLHRLTPAAVDALLGSSGAGTMLDAAIAGGAFLTPADGGGHRYRGPVREFLQAELLRTAPASIPLLRRRAASACERSGLVDEAIDHARASGDPRAATAIARRHALELARTGRVRMLEHVVPARRMAVVEELRRLEASGSPAELLGAAERVARSATELAPGQVRALLCQTAAAERAFALLLLGRYQEAHAAAKVVDLGPPSAARTQLAAVGAIAATRLGIHVAAAPLARAARSSAGGAGATAGRAAALMLVADGVVAATAGDDARAEHSLSRAVAAGDAWTGALALGVHAGACADARPVAARTLLDASRRALNPADSPLAAELAEEAERQLEPHERSLEPAEELSPAELRVLRLFGSRLTQREIARELYLSPNTVKTHARVIYRKLGVDGRERAVRAARELNLV